MKLITYHDLWNCYCEGFHYHFHMKSSVFFNFERILVYYKYKYLNILLKSSWCRMCRSEGNCYVSSGQSVVSTTIFHWILSSFFLYHFPCFLLVWQGLDPLDVGINGLIYDLSTGNNIEVNWKAVLQFHLLSILFIYLFFCWIWFVCLHLWSIHPFEESMAVKSSYYRSSQGSYLAISCIHRAANQNH